MKKVDVNLLGELIRLSENQVIRPVKQVNRKVVGLGDTGIIPPVPKKEEVAEGLYKVEVVSVKCSSATAYKVEFRILDDRYPDNPVINGYCRRHGTDCADLNRWFGDSEKITSTRQCKGKIGNAFYNPTTYGWFEPISKALL